MSGRAILSRPRTRVYDANYNIGESYYRPALDRLDRKYSGRPLSPPPPPSARQSSLPKDLRERHERAFFDEDLPAARRRAEKLISEPSLFDSRGGRIAQRAIDLVENDFDEETASTLKRIRANKKVSAIDDVDFESTVNNINSRRLLDRSDKILKTVGLDESGRRALDDDITIKRRSVRIAATQEKDVGDLTRWAPLVREVNDESAAVLRAKQSRDRLLDIEDEMNAVAERQQARERRAARLKVLVAESAEETQAAQSAIQAVQMKARRSQQTIDQ